MTGKRKLSDGEGSPSRKAARTASDESGSFGFSSSQFSQSFQLGVSPQPTSHPAMYLQPPSPQSCTTPQPETSQLDTSKLTEKSQWRNYTDPKGFCEFAGWDQLSQDKFESLFRSDREGEEFQDWLVDTAEIESSVLQTRLGKSGLNAKVNWTSVLPSSDTTLNNLMVTWIDLRKVTYILSRDRDQDKVLADQFRDGRASWKEVDPQNVSLFDEARECIDYEESQLFRSLRHVLRDRFERTKTPQESLPQGDFFGIFLDTTSRVTNFSPSVHLDSSQKVVDRMGNGRTLLPPIYQIKTMDIFAEEDDTEEDDTEEDGSAKAAVKFFRFGRPLWGSRCHPDSVPKDPASELISLASQKTDEDSLAKALALISYLAFINKERDLTRTVRPSEPILAYTAASKMINPKVRLKALREFMLSCFEGSLMSTGDAGDMVASIILLFAHDEKQFDDPTALPKPILLHNYLESLFGSERCDEMTQRMRTDADMKKLWETGIVYFNHFVNLKNPPTLETLDRAFSRAAAFFLPKGFPGADIIIPVKIPGVVEMTFCTIQVKNRKHDAFTAKVKTIAMADLKKAVDKLE
ncbi:uncharacterized protein ASPGLDRAFT_55518 [Aspergillus glaucus CBS 516.65]|uniref:Uncharacterized protein n=1 Tax=Aspergillus glaucus CBS 516.65 TaxID=1160497 RepID=A0A1L9VSW0_ASPGL|nr:hypothetical protein ASPGLDRAFT_55518 [Aspergillus glaucus CBS 516.65]OJJ87008.1 hypothetical protein ASPGLDRAFT_55518 [Aspergillus glaucus CBS 516.65]